MNILKKLYGNFESRDEVVKFLVLGLTFFFIIGVYWALRPLKDGLFQSIVGAKYQPYAKLISMLAVFPIVMFYSKLVDWFEKNKVFYILIGFYCVTAAAFCVAFMHPTIGLENTVESPSRIIGWLWYVWVESFGSLIVALFWAYIADITKPESAKRGYPIVGMGGQLGNIVGPLVLTNLGRLYFNGHNGPVVGIIAVLIFMIGFMIWLFPKVVSPSQRQKQEMAGGDKEPGFFEGLILLVKTPYLLSIFFIITFYEAIVAVFDFLFKMLVAETYTSSADRVAILGQYAWMVGVVAFLSMLFGINNIQRKLGMTASLLTLPLLVAAAILSTKFYGGLGFLFWVMVIAKAINYALNQPTMKQLYIPTSDDAKYKSQAWIEMFGSRASKGGGSVFNALRDKYIKAAGLMAGSASFMSLFVLCGLGGVALWIPVAIFAAKKYNKAVETNTNIC